MTYAAAVHELGQVAAQERSDVGIRPECRSIALLHGERAARRRSPNAS